MWDVPVFYRRDPDLLAGQIPLLSAVNIFIAGRLRCQSVF
jgi:hypothetical protein